MAATIVLAGLIFLALFGPLISPHDPNALELKTTSILQPPVWNARGSFSHLLGTDQLGRDVLSQLLVGARYTLMIAAGAVVLEAVIGVTIGLAAGYHGRWIDSVLMRWCDIQMSFPGVLLVLLILLLIRPTPLTIMLAFAVNNWMIFARMARSDTQRIKEEPFVASARVTGMRNRQIVMHHIFPHLTPRIVAVSLIELPRLIMAESSISFLGLGVQPPHWSWGLMIGQSQNLIPVAYWLGAFTGLAIAISVMSLHFFSRMVGPLLDPSLPSKERRGMSLPALEPDGASSLATSGLGV
jgi:peptide/nickel transport system permease protein